MQDAYNDPLFNKDVDVMTGFRTRNILCLPVTAQIDSSQEYELLGVARFSRVLIPV